MMNETKRHVIDTCVDTVVTVSWLVFIYKMFRRII